MTYILCVQHASLFTFIFACKHPNAYSFTNSQSNKRGKLLSAVPILQLYRHTHLYIRYPQTIALQPTPRPIWTFPPYETPQPTSKPTVFSPGEASPEPTLRPTSSTKPTPRSSKRHFLGTRKPTERQTVTSKPTVFSPGEASPEPTQPTNAVSYISNCLVHLSFLKL